ncbi:tetratricopeptide repeat protein [Nodosilinea sp. LEGE 07088]|uniref:CHAT domain-containing tetratricopeptide repeat protein n=1 Tax=Nodosilinea sp. LEGE 07088 TaxID=2777968 RepID=UPI00187EF943|nr:tetratricopeptide repeat protein [Nodosilinea sp. LEGE 07088]MBE9136769.1 tetratricopeptide repeat protein [Nodosilinea sp. LEGE 07088]
MSSRQRALIAGCAGLVWLMPATIMLPDWQSSAIALAQSDPFAEASRLYQEGNSLFQEGSEASLRQAVELWLQAVPLWQQAGAQRELALTLNNIGLVYDALGDRTAALDYYQQALPLIQALGDRQAEAAILTNIGVAHQALGETETALSYYQQALPLSRAVGDSRGEASVLTNMGNLYNALGDRETALAYYQQALPLNRAIGDQAGEASALTNIGNVYSALGEHQTALEYYQQALLLRQAVGDKRGEAVTLSNIGLVYDTLGDRETALDYYQQALPLRRAVGDRQGEAATLSNIGLVYDGLGDRKTALDYYQQALPLSRAVGDRQAEAVILGNLGSVYNALGERDTALDYYQQALPLSQAIGDRQAEATTLNNIGSLYDALGEREIALEHYQQALVLNQAVGSRRGEAATLSNIGAVYSDLGEYETALDYSQQALSLRRAVGDREGEAVTLDNIGGIYNVTGDYATALDYYQQALSLSRAVGDRQGEAVTLNNIGAIYQVLGNRATALEYYQQALPLRRAVGDRQGEATTLNNIGTNYQALGDRATALDYYQQALPLRRVVGDRPGEADTLYNLALLYQEQNQLEDALTAIDDAIALVEDLRLAISPGDLRSSYFATVQDYYQLKTDLLMQMGRPEAAFETSEASRARLLIELLSEANVDIRQGVDPALLAQEQALKTELQTIESRRIALRSGDYTQAEAAAIDRESEAVLQQLETKLTEIRRVSPAYADTVQPRPLTLALIQQQLLDEDTVLVQYALGENQSYLYLVGKDQFQSIVLPGREAIAAAAQAFRNAVAQPGAVTFIKRPAQALTAMILPELPDWAEGKRLLIAGDGVLSEIPFAALAVPGSAEYVPLLVEHEILSQPSISAVAILRQQLANRGELPLSIAVLADPVYGADDQRLSQKTNAPLPQAAERNLRDMDLQAIAPLPFTRTEANSILAQAQARSIPALSAFDFEANYDWVTNPRLNQYSVLHLATHGFINPVNPQLSGIVLSLVDARGQLRDDGFLRLHDIFNLRLAAELVVLSACQTGRGENVSGEGIIGLSRGFMYAGAERVAVSLWNVNDEATAALMGGLYGHLLEDGLTPAAALRAAQLDQWQAGQSPYYWAAFTLQGEWR